MNVDRLLARLEKESSLAVHLAEAVSLAVLIDPPLLRRARRELVPDADPGIEADLWTSSLVQTRSPDGLVFHPEVAQALRERLAADPGRLDRAWKLTHHVHSHFTPALQVEEEIAWLSVSDSPDAAARIEQLLRQAMAAIFAGERRGLAHWAARALPRLPSRVRALETARILEAGARLRLDGDARLLENESGDLGWIVPADLPRVPVRVRLLDGAVELDAGATGGTMLQVPQTDPLLVTVSWDEGGKEIARQATFRPGGKTTIPVPVDNVRLRTIRDEVYDLRISGQSGGRLRNWIIDFTEERKRHRPFLGREYDQEEIQRWIRQGRASGRMILVHGETGEGKTALLNHVIDRLAEAERLPPHHFFRRGFRSEEVERAERSLRAQIAGRFPELESAAAHLRLPDLLERISEQGIPDSHGEPLILVLDAIDEAQGEGRDLLLGLLPERLPPDVLVLASARSGRLDHLKLPEPLSYLPLSDATGALGKYWDHYLPSDRRLGLGPASPRGGGHVPIHNDELIVGSGRNFGLARVLRKWIEGAWWHPSEDFPLARIDIERLWNVAVERLGKESAEVWLGTLAAAKGSLPSSVLIEILGEDLFSQTRNSPFEPLLVGIDGPAHRLIEEVLRVFIADRVNLVLYHQHIAEIATAALEEGSGASGQLRNYAVRHAVQHWIAAGDLEGARRLAVSAQYLIPKCREIGVKEAQRELRDCIKAFQSIEPAGDEKVDRTTILESTLEILSRGPLPPALDPSLFLSHLFTGLLEQNWEPEIARAILGISLTEPALRPKELVDRPLRRPGDRRHSGPVVGCRFLERGDTVPAILSWSTDGTLRLWEPDSGEMIQSFVGHTAEVTGMALLDFGEFLTSSRDGTVQLWRLGHNGPVKIFIGHEGDVLGVVGLSTGRAVSWSADRTIRVWDVEAGREELVLRGHEDSVTACIVTPGQEFLISGSADTTVRQWDLSSGSLVSTWSGHAGLVTALAAGERFVASASLDRSLKIWPLRPLPSFEPIVLLQHGLGILGCTLLGWRLASWSYDQTIVVWSLNLGPLSNWGPPEQVSVLKGHTGAILSCTSSFDGDHLVSASADATVRIWDLGTGRTLQVLEGHTGSIRSVAQGHERNFSLMTWTVNKIVSASDDRTLRIWDAESGEEMAVLDGDNETIHCIALQDRRRVVTWSRMGDLKIYRVDSSEPPRWLGSPGMAVGGALVTPDDQRLILWSRGLVQGQIRGSVWDLERGQEIGTFGVPESPILAGAVTPDGLRLIAGSRDGSLSIWDLAEYQFIASIPAHSGPVVDIRVSSDGMWALTASWDGALRILDLRKMTSLEVGVEHRDRVFACAMHWDARAAVSASADRTLYLWNLDEGQGRRLAGHDDQVIGCAFARDGTRVVSCSLDKTLAIWEVRTGALLHRLRGHQDWVNTFVIDDDRGVVYSCSEDRTVRAWDLESGEQRGVTYGVSPFRSLALTYDGVAAGDEAGNFWALELEVDESASQAPAFDVFLSYNRKDLRAAEAIVAKLRDRGLRVWFDIEQVAAGADLQKALLQGIQASIAVVVLIGQAGFGNWQKEEVQLAMSRRASREQLMIPVLIPGGVISAIGEMPLALAENAWIDFQKGVSEEGLDRLIQGITGERGRPR